MGLDYCNVFKFCRWIAMRDEFDVVELLISYCDMSQVLVIEVGIVLVLMILLSIVWIT